MVDKKLNVPRSIAEICSQTGYKRFRFRNVVTLKDYLVVEVISYKRKLPQWVRVVSFDTKFPYPDNLNAEFENYGLLSSEEEMKLIAKMNESELSKFFGVKM